MKIKLMSHYLLAIGLIVMLTCPRHAMAGDEACDSGNCLSTTTVNQHACHTCGSYEYRCSNDTSVTCDAVSDCTSNQYTLVTCDLVCTDTSGDETTCAPLDSTFTCNQTGPGACAWVGDLENCGWTGNTCTGSTETPTVGCCGPGDGTTPKGCGGTCSKGSDCSSVYCTGGVCRNVNCPDVGSCTCPTTPSHTRSVVGLA